MIVFWAFAIGLPILAFGGVLLYSPALARGFSQWYRVSMPVACVLTVAAWFWTAYECDIIGIEFFDMLLKRFPGELWILAVVLSYLTIIWMPKNLPVRALTGILMLMPAELFKTTHLYRPVSGTVFAPVDVFVYVAYVGAVVGMYGMFYPWRLERGLDILIRSDARARTFGGILSALGVSVILIGLSLRG